MAHSQRRLLEMHKGSTLDEETWRLTTPAIAQAGVVSLRGLPDRVVAEILYGPQERVTVGIRHKDHHIRPSVTSFGPGRSARWPNSTYPA